VALLEQMGLEELVVLLVEILYLAPLPLMVVVAVVTQTMEM
jgi:hypothetical protein